MRAIVLAAALATGFIPFAQADDVNVKIQEGVRLHDAQDYQGAMSIYRAILEAHPHHPTAVYELAYSMRAAGVDGSEVLAFLENEAESDTRQHFALYILLGAAYDEIGELAKGEAAFRRGLDGAPDSPDLHFNLGVNLGLQKRWSDAAGSYVKAIAERPEHVNSWFNLAVALENEGRSARAFVAYARAVSMEPESARGRSGAKRLWPLLFDNIRLDSELDPTKPTGDITITVPTSRGTDDAEDAKLDPLAMEALVMSIVAANRYVEEWEKKSDTEFFAHALESVTEIASETLASGDDFWTVAVPYFNEARRRKHLEAMAYALREAAGDPEATRWIAEHRKRATAYAEWARSRAQ